MALRTFSSRLIHSFVAKPTTPKTGEITRARFAIFSSVRLFPSIALMTLVALGCHAVSQSVLEAAARGNAPSKIGQAATLSVSVRSPEGIPANSGASGNLSISLNGANQLQEECGNSFDDPGATAVNGAGKPVPVQVSGKVDTSVLGTYELTYVAVDEKDSAAVGRSITVVDTTPPEITLEGGSTVSVICGEAFTDPGASARDGCNGNVAVEASGRVDTNVQGGYLITYTATDSNGNAKTVSRTVIVGSTEDNPPTVTLTSDAEITLECGGTFIDPGAIARTVCSGYVPVITSGIVDPQTAGSYTITYAASSGSLTAEATRYVTVVDSTAPVISLNGNNPLIVARGSAFTDPGATARDACAGEFAAAASGNVDTHKTGSYVITYRASDASGHQATPVTLTVRVVEKLSLTEENFPLVLNLGRLHGLYKFFSARY